MAVDDDDARDDLARLRVPLAGSVTGTGDRFEPYRLADGDGPDPRDAQITRLKDEATRLKERLAQSAAAISDLTDFRTQALAP